MFLFEFGDPSPQSISLAEGSVQIGGRLPQSFYRRIEPAIRLPLPDTIGVYFAETCGKGRALGFELAKFASGLLERLGQLADPAGRLIQTGRLRRSAACILQRLLAIADGES